MQQPGGSNDRSRRSLELIMRFALASLIISVVGLTWEIVTWNSPAVSARVAEILLLSVGRRGNSCGGSPWGGLAGRSMDRSSLEVGRLAADRLRRVADLPSVESQPGAVCGSRPPRRPSAKESRRLPRGL